MMIRISVKHEELLSTKEVIVTSKFTGHEGMADLLKAGEQRDYHTHPGLRLEISERPSGRHLSLNLEDGLKLNEMR